jgi:hypothetical protein
MSESADAKDEPLAERYLERRIETKGLRPRIAAAVIAVLWLIAIVVFGLIEHIVDGSTFDDVWEGMWWATQTVTTVGYVVALALDAALVRRGGAAVSPETAT